VNLAVNKELFAIGTVHWKFVAWFQAEQRGLCLEWSIWRRVCILEVCHFSADGVFRVPFRKSCGHIPNAALLVDVSSNL